MNSSRLDRIRGWIFDLDGTLTRPLHDFAAMRRALGIPAGEPILEFIAARPGPVRDRLNRRLDELEMEVAQRAVINPGADELISMLAGQGCRLGIFTRNRRRCVQVALERTGLEAYFAAEGILACEDAAPKPDPEGILRLLDRWKLAPAEVAMVGDFRFDLEAGRRAGCVTLHLAHGDEVWPELTDLRIASLRELIPLAGRH